MKSRYRSLSQKVRSIFKRIDRSSAQVQLATGIRCREGCGECCLSPKVEAMPIEMIPLALYLKRLKKLELYLSIAKRLLNQYCIFYSPNPFDPSLGKCSVYHSRPSLCRLFGFAARKNKYGTTELASCLWHKKLSPELCDQANEKLAAAQITPSLLSQFHFQLQNLSTHSRLTKHLLINEAFIVAAEHLLSEFDYSDERPNIDPVEKC